MKVLGYKVMPSVEQACLSRMHSGWFSAANIAYVAERYGKLIGHSPIAYRIADRLIQRERKNGNLRRFGKGWTWKPLP